MAQQYYEGRIGAHLVEDQCASDATHNLYCKRRGGHDMSSCPYIDCHHLSSLPPDYRGKFMIELTCFRAKKSRGSMSAQVATSISSGKSNSVSMIKMFLVSKFSETSR